MIGLTGQILDNIFSSNAINSFSVKLIHSVEGFMGGMTQEDINRKLENNNNNVEPVRGPIGDVTGMDASFTKLYLSYGRVQMLPKDFRLQLSVSGEFTDSKKVPADYKFAAADGGVKGYFASLAIVKPVLPNLTLGTGFVSENAISYFHSIDSPGCGGINKSEQEFTCTDNKGFIKADFDNKDWSVNLQYFTDIKSYDQNGLNFRAVASYKW